MTVYNQVSNNKLRTGFLMLLFVVFLSFVFFLFGKYVGGRSSFLFLGFLIALISSIGSYFYSDKIVLFSTGAKPADKKHYFDFYTVAENISIAAGLPMPKLYVINDSSPNAFATGRDPKHAVVCATTGLLSKLNRAELEGVIAHETSHIKNYDILLSSIVSVLVGTLVLASDWIMRSFWWRGLGDSDENRSNNPIFLVLFILTLIIAPIVATLIQLAVSRKREFLADASGVLITRYPEGLANALEKISKDPNALRHVSGANAHLFISDPFKNKKLGNKLTALFSTHPPIEERIRILRSI